MGNYKFYTPPMLAECLVALLPKRKYNNIIDICCGSWNLLEAARKQFGTAKYVGVDVDVEAKANCFEGATFFCDDGRAFAIKEKKKYDLILSNPPFGYLKEKERMSDDLSVLNGNIKKLNSKRYENEMMFANLCLAEENAVLLFILPATFVEGDTYLSVRKEICSLYKVDSVIKLPLETFGSGRISTYAIIITNTGKQDGETKLQEVICENDMWMAKLVDKIPFECMRDGEWVKKNVSRKDKGSIEIFRGIISSSNMSSIGTKVYHSSSIMKNGIWEPSIRFCNDPKKIEKSRVVLPGDIIVNRVGRFAKCWCVCKEEGILSDCLMAIRTNNNPDVYEKLVKSSRNGILKIPTKGVAVKYITMGDVLNLL